MATYVKGNIKFTPVVEQINRKFAVRKKTCSLGRKHGPVTKETASWMGAATTVKGRGGLGTVSKNYFVYRENARSSQPTQAEQNVQAIFTIVSVAVRSLMKNLNQISRIQAAYMEASNDLRKTMNGVSAEGYTFKGWVFAVQFAGKYADGEYDVNMFPQDFD